MTDNPCGTNTCTMKRDGDGSIPENLREKWNDFIAEKCAGINCQRRYMTRCCKWGEFEVTS